MIAIQAWLPSFVKSSRALRKTFSASCESPWWLNEIARFVSALAASYPLPSFWNTAMARRARCAPSSFRFSSTHISDWSRSQRASRYESPSSRQCSRAARYISIALVYSPRR